MTRKREYYKNKYHYWKTSKGIFKVHIYEGGKRKVAERKTEEGMIEYLIALEGEKTERKVTFKHCYENWRRVHDKLIDSNTVQKYLYDYKRFFRDSDFEMRNITDISKDVLLDFMAENVRHPKVRGIRSEQALNRRAAKALWGYITNTFEWAEEHEYLDASRNPCRKIDPKKTFYRLTEERERPDDIVVIPPDQIMALNEQFRKDHEEDPGYMPVYALELASLTGMRAGEIVALKWADIQGNYLQVRRRESMDKLTGEFRIKTVPKNKKPRPVPLTEPILELLERVRKVCDENGWTDEFIFTGQDGRITVPILSSCLKNKCKQQGISAKGVNAYRRTVNSLIRANGLSAEAASAILGNSPAVNTQYYTFDVTEGKRKKDILERVNQFILDPKGAK